ncbi:hypothetical protein QEH68_11920 [Paenarthrobacter sp. OM7]|uniref:hypothetical protein n=1 Tax=Paenarthrobacter sp. OM7 TaxID=3041264 RepID=UPI0024683404|nr:hypothetical protein [Paenarthrobacter sp. OM7]WGM18765.1 hypothetical protein QEH68_11920 [Paenarthrobacter sp. OM7]
MNEPGLGRRHARVIPESAVNNRIYDPGRCIASRDFLTVNEKYGRRAKGREAMVTRALVCHVDFRRYFYWAGGVSATARIHGYPNVWHQEWTSKRNAEVGVRNQDGKLAQRLHNQC